MAFDSVSLRKPVIKLGIHIWASLVVPCSCAWVMYREVLHKQPYIDGKVETRENFYEKIGSTMIACDCIFRHQQLGYYLVHFNTQDTCYFFSVIGNTPMYKQPYIDYMTYVVWDTRWCLMTCYDDCDYDVCYGNMMTIYVDYDAWYCYHNMMMFSMLSKMYVMNAILQHVENSA